ncbi:MAG TPA: alpha/beta hydrolase [Solirubrobacterales bacterium]|nr:alpha/beta hydrolase [Solirubrobacterales bacterium]
MPSPEMEATARQFAGPFPLDPAGGRTAYDALGSVLPPDPETRWEATEVGGIGGPHSEWQWWDGVGEERVVLYMHGGGYVIGSPPSWRQFGGRLSREANVRLLNFDYRLAPEHPFPAAVEDAIAAYRWLLSQGWDPERIALGGDSAGGALGITLMVALRDAGDPLPACHLSLCPWADLTNGAESLDDPSVEDPNPELRPLAEAMAENYLQGQDPEHPHASPLFADLAGLSPVQIEVSGRDGIRSDALRLGEALREAGVEVSLNDAEGTIHGYHMFAPETPEASEGIARLSAFLETHLAAPTPSTP